MKHIIAPTFSFFLLFTTAVAQSNCTLHGVIIDSSAKPIEDGIVSAFRQNDSMFIKYSAITNGTFDLQEIASGNYFLKISCPGYEDKFQKVTLSANDSLVISMKQKQLTLTQVEVTGYKKAFGFKNGNIKATVENTILSSLPDAVEVLSKLPTVQVSGDRESISVIGKGDPIIYLENQRITPNELKALSVNDIKSIEIINNPSSKYEADGRAVILISRRSNTKEGVRIDMSETPSVKRYFENRAGINVSYKKTRTELKCNVQYNYMTRFEGLQGVINSDAFNYRSNFSGTSIGPRKQLPYGAGIYHQLNKGDYFSLNVSGRIQKEQADVNTNTQQDQSGITTNVFTKNTNSTSRPFFNSNFNYLKKLNKVNGQLFIGGQYSHYTIGATSDINNNYNNTQLLHAEKRQQDFRVDVETVRLDFEKNLKQNIKWESGAVINMSKSTTDFDINYVPVSTELVTHYNYKENNQSLYTQLSEKFKKMDYIIGLRAENTMLQGGYKDSSQLLVDKSFIYFFPKINISIPIDSFKTLTLNYARSIHRPNYSNANQVTNYITPFLERSNNINLVPALTDELSVTLQHKNYSLNATLYRTQSATWYITEYDPLLKKIRMINMNFALRNGANISLTLPFEYKRFTSTNDLMVSIEQAKDARAIQFKTSPYYYIYSNNQFRLPKNYIVVLSGWLTTKQYEGIFVRNSQFAVDISVSKVFYKKLTCTINAFDIFRSLNYVEAFNVNGIYSATTYLENTKEYSISIKYSFGKIKDANFRNKEVNENSNRLN